MEHKRNQPTMTFLLPNPREVKYCFRGERICPSLILLLVISIRCVIGSVFDETEWSMLPIPSQKTRETRLIKDCSYPHFLRVPDTFLNTKPMRHAFSG